jgi:xanthine dehydrogenase YagR molybdenum-binding subunit
VFVKANGPAGGVPFADLLRRANLRLVYRQWQIRKTFGEKNPKFSTHSFGCHFVEVTWQPEDCRLRVNRGGHRHRCGTDYQSTRGTQPDRRRES